MQVFKKIVQVVRKEEYWLYLLVFLLPLQTRWMIRNGELNGGYWEYGTISLYAVDLLVISLLVYRFTALVRAGTLQRWMAGGVRRDTFWLIAGVLELAVVVSVLSAPREGLALYGYLRFALAMGVGWLVLHSRANVAGVAAALLANGAVQGIVALWQVYRQQVHGSTLLGMAAQVASNAGVAVVEVGEERWLRAYGMLPHPNVLGGWLALALVAGVAWQIKQLTTPVAQQRSHGVILAGWLALALTTAGLVISFSRAAWLGAVAGLGAYAISILWTKDTMVRTTITGVMVAVILMAAAVGGAWYVPLTARISATERLERRSLDERAAAAADARGVISAHPVLGVGVRNSGIAVRNEIDSGRPAYGYEPVHNTFLLVWAEIGLAGLLAVAAIMAYILALAVGARQPAALGLVIVLAAVMVFDHWLWSLPFGLYTWWLIVALAARMSSPLARL